MLGLFLFAVVCIVGTPAPHITTWDGLHYDFAMPKDILRNSYRRDCATPQGCGRCTNVTFSSASFMPPTAPLESIPAWQKAHGVWVGNFTYSLESDSQFPGDYKSYHGIIFRRARGNAYHQKNIFFYPRAANWAGTCGCSSSQFTARKLPFGYGIFRCGGGGAVKIFPTVVSKQVDDQGSLAIPDDGTTQTCTDAQQYTNVLGANAMACGMTSTAYTHNQAIVMSNDDKMYRSWIDSTGLHSYYQEEKVAADIGSALSPKPFLNGATSIESAAKALMARVGIGDADATSMLAHISGGQGLEKWLQQDGVGVGACADSACF